MSSTLVMEGVEKSAGYSGLGQPNCKFSRCNLGWPYQIRLKSELGMSLGHLGHVWFQLKIPQLSAPGANISLLKKIGRQ